MSSQSPTPHRRRTLLPSAKQEGSRRSGEMAREVLDMEAGLESEAERVHPETGWSKTIKSNDWNRRLLIALTIVCSLFLLWSIGYFLFGNQGVQNSPGAPISKEGNPALQDHSVGGFMEDASPEELRRATQLAVEGFLNAKTLAERCQFIHGGKSHLAKMQEVYARAGKLNLPNGFSKIVLERLETVESIPFVFLRALDDCGETHVFNLLPTNDGMLIDWESSVCYGEMTWEKFQEEMPEGPVLMRVLLSKRHSEDDVSTPLDFALLSERDNRSHRIVYIDPDGEVSRTLKEVFETGASFYPYTLYVSWNAERQVAEVSGLKHLYWMDPEIAR